MTDECNCYLCTLEDDLVFADAAAGDVGAALDECDRDYTEEESPEYVVAADGDELLAYFDSYEEAFEDARQYTEDNRLGSTRVYKLVAEFVKPDFPVEIKTYR